MWLHTFSLSYELYMTAEPWGFGSAQHEHSCFTYGFTAAGMMVMHSNTRHVKVQLEEQDVWCSYLWLLPVVRHGPAPSDQRGTQQRGTWQEGRRAFLSLLETYWNNTGEYAETLHMHWWRLHCHTFGSHCSVPVYFRQGKRTLLF